MVKILHLILEEKKQKTALMKGKGR